MLLALDTATAAVTVAVHDGNRLLADRTTIGARRHAELLGPLIEQVLDQAGVARQALTAICCGVGPGPFTSLRVGLVSAHALGYALGVPVHGLCSLDAMAAGAHGLRAGDEFWVATDARRREVYSARYVVLPDGPPRRVAGPFVGPAAAVDRSVASGSPPGSGPGAVAVVGRGAELYPDQLGPGAPPWDVAAADLAAVAVHALAADPARLLPPVPLYLRRPDAAEPGARKRVLR